MVNKNINVFLWVEIYSKTLTFYQLLILYLVDKISMFFLPYPVDFLSTFYLIFSFGFLILSCGPRVYASLGLKLTNLPRGYLYPWYESVKKITHPRFKKCVISVNSGKIFPLPVNKNLTFLRTKKGIPFNYNIIFNKFQVITMRDWGAETQAFPLCVSVSTTRYARRKRLATLGIPSRTVT